MERDTLIQYFQGQGFEPNGAANYQQIALAPDVVVEHGNTMKAVVIRESSDSLPETMIQRFAGTKRIPSKTVEIYFAFPSKPNMKILTTCKAYGVGILYTNSHSAVEVYAESRQIKGRRPIAAIPKTQIFFSSKQQLDERNTAENLIDEQRDALKVPLFPMLVENDQQYSSDLRKLWPVICSCMDDCQYVLVILSGEYRRIIDRETRRALEYYDPEEILFYIKNDRETKEAWEDLILVVTQHNVKYTDYFDLRNFKSKLHQRVMKIIMKLHKDNGVPFLEDAE